MAQVTIDEERLGELIQDEVQKHFKLTFEDMDEMRRSPAASVIRLEAHFDTIEKNMATKADVANLRTELSEVKGRVDAIEQNMATKAELGEVKARVIAIEQNMAKKARVDSIEQNMATKTDLANLRAELKAEIADLRERIGKLEANQKLMLGLMLSTFGAVLAALVKLFFLS